MRHYRTVRTINAAALVVFRRRVLQGSRANDCYEEDDDDATEIKGCHHHHAASFYYPPPARGRFLRPPTAPLLPKSRGKIAESLLFNLFFLSGRGTTQNAHTYFLLHLRAAAQEISSARGKKIRESLKSNSKIIRGEYDVQAH